MDKLFSKFKEVGFETTVSKQEMPYDSSTVLTENNITDYLQEIEELISYMITYQAVRMNEPNASLASVAVKNLPEKSFDKKVHTVKQEAHTNESYENEYAKTMARTQDGDDFDFNEMEAYETDTRLLLKRFHEMLERSQQAIQESREVLEIAAENGLNPIATTAA